MKPILYRPEIQDDLNEACRWYEQRREGLGDEFLRAVEKTLDEISETLCATPRCTETCAALDSADFPTEFSSTFCAKR